MKITTRIIEVIMSSITGYFLAKFVSKEYLNYSSFFLNTN